MKILNPIEIQKIGTPAGNPASGFVYVYTKSDNKVYRKDSTGVETCVEGAGGVVAPVTTRIRRSTNQSIAAGGSYVDLSFDTSAYQVNGTFWTSGATVTIPEDGYYQVFAEATFEGAAVAVTCDMQVQVNGSSVIGDDQKMVAASATAPLQVMAQRYFTAGNTIKVQVKHSNATALNVLTQGDHSPDIIVTKLTGAKGDIGPAGGVDLTTNQTVAGEKTWSDRAIFDDSIVIKYRKVLASAMPLSGGAGSARLYLVLSDDYFIEVEDDVGSGIIIEFPTLTTGRQLYIKAQMTTSACLVRWNTGSGYIQGSLSTSIHTSQIYNGFAFVLHISTSNFHLKNLETEQVFGVLPTLFQTRSEKSSANGYGSIDSSGLFHVLTGQGGVTIPFGVSITVTNPDGTSKGFFEWYQTIDIGGILGPLPNFDGTEIIAVYLAFPADVLSDMENSPDTVDLEYITATPTAGTTEIEIYAKFKERVNGKVFLGLQIKKSNLTI